jgi:putative ABC transport system permease protein
LPASFYEPFYRSCYKEGERSERKKSNWCPKKGFNTTILGESFLLSLMGVLIALPLLFLSLPYLNQITQADIQLSFLHDYRLWLMLALLVIITGLVAGSYPAFYLSAFQIIKVLKGNFSSPTSAQVFVAHL